MMHSKAMRNMPDKIQVADRMVYIVAIFLLSSILFGQNAAAVPVGWSVVVDDLDPDYSETGNAWASYTYPDAVNGRYRYLSHMGHTVSRKGTATWQAGIPASGIYSVEIHYRPTENRTTDADFLVYDGKGSSHHYSVDQTFHGPLSSTGWVTLGKFAWTARQTAKVVLDGTDDEYSDEADAVRWTLVEITKDAAPSAPLVISQRLLLNSSPAAANTVNLAGNWLETGGWDDCPTPATNLTTMIIYSLGRYTFLKNGFAQNPAPDCRSQSIASHLKTVAPTSQLVTKSTFTAMMREIFSRAYGISILSFSKDRITYKIYFAEGIQTRTLTRQ